MAVFAGFGSVFGTFAGSAPQLIAHFNLDNGSYGLGVTIMSAATVASMGMAGFLTRRFSHRTLILAMLPLTFALLVILFSSTALPLFFLFTTLLGVFSGILDVIMNAEGGAIEADLKRPVYTAFHGAVSSSIALFAILSSLLSTRYGTSASLLATAIPVALAWMMVYRSVPPRPLPPRRSRHESRPPLLSVFTKPLVLMGVAAGLIISSEISALLWSSKLLADTAPQLAAIAGLGAAFFSMCNAAIRFLGDRLRARFGEIRLMTGALALAIASFTGLGLSEGFAANVVFFALCGMGTAVLCPCLFAMAARETPHNRAAGLGASLVIAGIPRVIAPTAFGAIADVSSIHVAFGLCAVALAAALGAIRLLPRP